MKVIYHLRQMSYRLKINNAILIIFMSLKKREKNYEI